MGFLNYPIETPEAERAWASKSKVNKCLAVIAFSLNEENAIMNLRRVLGLPYLFRRYHAWNNLGCYVNQPDMKNVPFHDINTLWWDVMPYREDEVCWGGGGEIPLSLTKDLEAAGAIGDDLFISWAGSKKPFTVVVYDSTDKVIHTESNYQSNSFTYSTTSLPAGGYYIIVTDSSGATVRTRTINLSASASSAPVITKQPTSSDVKVGQPFTMSVTATGSGTLTYQWQEKTGGTWNSISHTEASWTSANTTSAGARTFRVMVTNKETGKDATTITSSEAVATAYANLAWTASNPPAEATIGSGSVTVNWVGGKPPYTAKATNNGKIFNDQVATDTTMSVDLTDAQLTPGNLVWEVKDSLGTPQTITGTTVLKQAAVALTDIATATDMMGVYDTIVDVTNPAMPYNPVPSNATIASVLYELGNSDDGTVRGITINPTTGVTVIPAKQVDGSEQSGDNVSVKVTVTDSLGNSFTDSSDYHVYGLSHFLVEGVSGQTLKVGDTNKQFNYEYTDRWNYTFSNESGTPAHNEATVGHATITVTSSAPAILAVASQTGFDVKLNGVSAGSATILTHIAYGGAEDTDSTGVTVEA